MDTNEIINQLREENEQLKKDVKMHRDAESEWEKAMMQLVGEDGIGSVSDAINLMKLRLKNQDVMITTSLGVSGQIKKAAFELGYHDSMEVSELDYLIETARASVMVNQKNVELTGQRDNAWQELREIREAISANPEESTADEVRRIMSQLVAVQDSVVHGKCANSEPCATFCEAIAARKMFKQLQADRDALLVYAIDAEKWFNKHDPHGYVSPKRAEVQAVLAAHDAEVAKAAFIEGACSFDCDHALYPEQIETQAEEYAAQLRAKVGA